MRSILGALGRLTLTLASMAFLTAIGLLVLGSWLATWPVMRLSPRDQRIRASVHLASNAMALLGTFGAPPAGSSSSSGPADD